MQTFEGKTVVVTGSASGIGLALAERFAAERMNVVLADIEQNALDWRRDVWGVQARGAVPVGDTLCGPESA